MRGLATPVRWHNSGFQFVQKLCCRRWLLGFHVDVHTSEGIRDCRCLGAISNGHVGFRRCLYLRRGWHQLGHIVCETRALEACEMPSAIELEVSLKDEMFRRQTTVLVKCGRRMRVHAHFKSRLKLHHKFVQVQLSEAKGPFLVPRQKKPEENMLGCQNRHLSRICTDLLERTLCYATTLCGSGIRRRVLC